MVCLVGDIMVLEAGMVFPADGLITECTDLEVNEASITGENDNIIKLTFDNCLR